MAEKKNTAWGGRFSESQDELMLEFGASIDVDYQLLSADIAGSVAWAYALGRAGILSGSELDAIVNGLDQLNTEMSDELIQGEFEFNAQLEDIHMTVEARLTALVGDAAAKLHTGRSRNDQVATDERLYLMAAIKMILDLIRDLQSAIIARAEEHIDDIVPSYTHLQQAQPVRLGHYIMAWFWMLERDYQRLEDASVRCNVMPLGSGAATGSAFDIDREALAADLGFSDISDNSIDATSDRDYIMEFISAGAIMMTHLSRISEDLIIWSSAEFGFASLSERYSTGSSMMPQKKNPDSLELVRGKTGRVYGNLMAILTVMKGLPFSYAKDMQEDKEPLFDTINTLNDCLQIARGVIESVEFKIGRMEEAFDSSVFATDIADYLTRKGMPFRKAHEVAGSLVKQSQKEGIALSSLPLDVYRTHSSMFEKDIENIFDLRNSTDLRSIQGGTGKQALISQIEDAKELVAQEGYEEE